MRVTRVAWCAAAGASYGFPAPGITHNTPPKQYFPIRNRVLDHRVDRDAAMFEAQITFRRRELRTEVDTGNVRQTSPSTVAGSTRPTHFLALRLPPRNEFSRAASGFVEDVKFSNPRFKDILIQPSKYHVTLSVFTFDEAVSVPEVGEAVKSSFGSCGPVRLQFRGLGTFGQRVLFARVNSSSSAFALDKSVRTFRKSLIGIPHVKMVGNPYDSFVPHITLAKLRPRHTATLGRTIAPSMWANFQHNSFGDVTFNTIDLCEMKSDSENGYYKVVQEFQL